jgi:hypothetical protein
MGLMIIPILYTRSRSIQASPFNTVPDPSSHFIYLFQETVSSRTHQVATGVIHMPGHCKKSERTLTVRPGWDPPTGKQNKGEENTEPIPESWRPGKTNHWSKWGQRHHTNPDNYGQENPERNLTVPEMLTCPLALTQCPDSLSWFETKQGSKDKQQLIWTLIQTFNIILKFQRKKVSTSVEEILKTIIPAGR